MANKNTLKKRRYRTNKFWKQDCLSLLTEEMQDLLAGIDHPKLAHVPEHSMLSYVYWLIEHNYTFKAQEIMNGYTSTDCTTGTAGTGSN